MSIQKREMVSGERRKHTIFGSVCSDLSMSFVKINGAKANSLGRLFVWPPLIIVRGRKLVLRANAIRFS